MHYVLLAGIGGFIGSSLRYLINTWVYNLFDYPTFPYGTMFVNITGCLIIGFLSGVAESREIFTPELRIFVFIGILGGYTTFSSFGYDTFGLWREGQMFLGLVNVGVQVVVGLSCVWLGNVVSRIL